VNVEQPKETEEHLKLIETELLLFPFFLAFKRAAKCHPLSALPSQILPTTEAFQ